MWMMRQLLDQDLVVDHLRGIGEDVTAEEAREWAQKQIRDLEDGTVWVDAGHDREVGGMFMFAEKIVPIIAGAMDWFVMHTAIGVSRRFIIGDHPVAMVDETVPKTHGVGWMGSPDVEVTLPSLRPVVSFSGPRLPARTAGLSTWMPSPPTWTT